MTDAQNKAQTIYDLLSSIATGNIYYWGNGALHFNFRMPYIFGYLDCLVTPVNNKYKIKVYKPINIATTVILHEVDGIDESELCNYFSLIKNMEWSRDKKWN
jgi:hypothetical protein